MNMPPAGIGISPINPLGLEPPDMLQRSQSERVSVGRAGLALQTQTNTLIRAPDPNTESQEIENNLNSPILLERQQEALKPPDPPKPLQAMVDRGIGGQIDLLAF